LFRFSFCAPCATWNMLSVSARVRCLWGRPRSSVVSRSGTAWFASSESMGTGRERDKTRYILPMFPYPSGKLHMGHVRVYTISDCLARFWRLKGQKVLHPMGWDAFGLPAENAAMERGVSPSKWTMSNIDSMRKQMDAIGLEFDWAEEANEGRGVMTCSPDYYKWTQWIFLEMYKNGMAYQKESEVNWDPVDKTVLANEQIDSDGKSWRSGAIAEKRRLVQWFFKTTEYQEELLVSLDTMDGWPEKVRQMQRNWIGKSSGASVLFDVNADSVPEPLQVFTTRLDTIFGVTFLAVSTGHPLVEFALERAEASSKEDILKFLKECESDRWADGSDGHGSGKGKFLGVYATHPLTGKDIPVYVADYVIDEYGDGAVMGVPAHDDRDFVFAESHGIDSKAVVEPLGDPSDVDDKAYTGKGKLLNSGTYSGMGSDKAIVNIAAELEENGAGRLTEKFRLRDWPVSRQRFWGTPIPIIHCKACGPVPVPEEDLPVVLPSDSALIAREDSPAEPSRDDQALETPLSKSPGWNDVTCPSCGAANCSRDPDTLDTFVDSSWYFLRYGDPANTAEAFSKESEAQTMPVDTYIGGIEHAVMHLLYARFLQRFLWHTGYASNPEPFKKLLTQGMVLGKTFKCPETGRYLLPGELDYENESEGMPSLRDPEEHGGASVPVVAWEKMSKSKHNGVDPETVVNQYGSDVTRLASMFVAPPEQALEWDESAVAGQARWLGRIEQLVDKVHSESNGAEMGENDGGKVHETASFIRREVHSTIQSVTSRFEAGNAFNVTIAELMKLSNMLSSTDVEKAAKVSSQVSRERLEGVKMMLVMLMPFAPKRTETLLRRLDGELGSAFAWPNVDPSALSVDSGTVVVQVGGKKRAVLEIPIESCRDRGLLEAAVMKSAEAEKVLRGQTPKKTIVVPGKTQKKTGKLGMSIVNFVL
jgi:leucyl-tRNA synthetase